MLLVEVGQTETEQGNNQNNEMNEQQNNSRAKESQNPAVSTGE